MHDIYPPNPEIQFYEHGSIRYWREIETWWDFTVEIKPTTGDDYPAVLRQMKANGSVVLLVDTYTGHGATREQFIKTFATAGRRVVFVDEIQTTAQPPH